MSPAQKQVESRIEGTNLRHDPTNPQGRNSVNNTQFAVRNGRVVEIVRTGPTNTRVRPDLKGNGRSYLVPSSELKGLLQFGTYTFAC